MEHNNKLCQLNNLSRVKPTPWFDKYTNVNTDKQVTVIGGGISGATTAYSLAQRGFEVTLYEKNLALAMEASNNQQGILYGSFSAYDSPMQELSLAGYRYSHNLITTLMKTNTDSYNVCGLIQIAHDSKQLAAYEALSTKLPPDLCQFINTNDRLEKISAIKNTHLGGLYFPMGLWLDMPSFINRLVKHSHIKIILDTNIDSINCNLNGKWDIYSQQQQIGQSTNVVLCTATHTNQFNITQSLDLRKIRGQSTIIRGNIKLNSIICGQGYITPNKKDCYTIGASFDFKNLHTQISITDHLYNVAMAKLLLPHLKNTKLDIVGGQANIRSSTYDYMPLVGPIANYRKFIKVYTKLRNDAKFYIDTPCPYHKGIYLNIAHGAKGILTAPICAEIVASYINNTTLSCSERLRQALHPNRIYLRKLIKSPR